MCTATANTEKNSLQIFVTAAQIPSHTLSTFSHHVYVFDIGVENHVT